MGSRFSLRHYAHRVKTDVLTLLARVVALSWWLLAEAARVYARMRGCCGTVSPNTGRFVRMQSRQEALLACEFVRAGIRWEYAPRIGLVRVADFRLPDHGGLLVEVYSGRNELWKSPLPNCALMPDKTKRGMRRWIKTTLGRSSAD